MKKISSYYLDVYNIEDMTLFKQVQSPCLGYIYKLEIQENLDLMMQHCLGIYQIHSLSTLEIKAQGRFTNKLNLKYVYTPNNNEILFINKNYFLDIYLYNLFIYEIDYTTNQVNNLGSFQQETALGSIADYEIIDTPNNIFVRMVLYSHLSLQYIQLPISGENTCQETVQSSALLSTVQSIQSIYTQVQSYFDIQTLKFNIIVNQETIMQPLPKFAFSSRSQMEITSDSKLDSQQKIIVSESFFSSFNGYNMISLENVFIEPIITQKQYLEFLIQNIEQLQFSNIQFGCSSLYTFKMSNIQQILFNRISFSNVIMQISKTINLFYITNVNLTVIDTFKIQESTFNQIILFYFEDDLVQNPETQIIIKNIQIESSKFTQEQIYSQNSQMYPLLHFSNINQIIIQSLKIYNNIGVSQPLITSYIIENLTLQEIEFSDNQYFNLISYNKIQTKKLKTTSLIQQIDEDYLILSDIQIHNNEFGLINDAVIKIDGYSFVLDNCDFSQNKVMDNSVISLIQADVNSLQIDNFKFISNSEFNSLFSINNSDSPKNKLSQISLISNTILSGITIQNSQIKIEKSNFKENQMKGDYSFSSLSILSQSDCIISETKFESNTAQKGGSLYADKSKIVIQNCEFLKDESTVQGGSIFSSISNISLLETDFKECKSIIGGCIYVEGGNLFLSSVVSFSSLGEIQGGFLVIYSTPVFTIKNLNLQESSSNNGGGIYIYNSGGVDSHISHSTFQNNYSKGSGGSLLIDKSELMISNCIFIGNQAGIGGAIRYINYKPMFMFNHNKLIKDSCKTYSQNYCKQNRAIIFGDSFASYPQFASFLPNDEFGVDITEYPKITFNNFRSGLSNFQWTIQMLDEFKNEVKQIDFQDQQLISRLDSDLVKEVRQYNCRVYIKEVSQSLKDETIKIEGASSVDYNLYDENRAGCILSNLKVTGVPSSSSKLNLQIQGMKMLDKSNNFQDVTNIEISINFRGCIIGEYFGFKCEGCQLQECVQCTIGSYSLTDPLLQKTSSCKICDQTKTKSCQLNQIELKQNYWRESSESDLIFDCDTTNNACNGDESKRYCSIGYVGALCSACDNLGSQWGQKYGNVDSINSQSMLCLRCSDIGHNVGKQILIFATILFYLIFLMIESQNSNCKMCQIRVLNKLNMVQMGVSSFILQTSVISKIFINQFQILSALKSTIGFSFPNLLVSLFSIPQVAAQPIYIFIYSFDCFLSDLNYKIPIPYMRFIYISILLPLVFLLLIFLIIQLIVYSLRKIIPSYVYYTNSKYNSMNMVICSLIVFFYIATQNIYQAGLEVIFCQKFDNKYYMKSQMDQECYTPEHYFWISFLIVPILILVTVVYPLVLLLILYKNSTKLFDKQSTEVIRRYGYYYQGFKESRWWWEFVKTYQKFIILLLATIFKTNVLIQIQTILLVITIYVGLLLFFKPYQSQSIQTLELKSTIYTMMIFWCAVINEQSDNYVVKAILIILLYILIALLFGSLTSNFLEALIRRNYYFLKKLQFIKKCFVAIISVFNAQENSCFRKYLQKNHSITNNLLFNSDHDIFSVFIHWKKLRKSVQNRNWKQKMQDIPVYVYDTKSDLQEINSSNNQLVLNRKQDEVSSKLKHERMYLYQQKQLFNTQKFKQN